MKYPNMSARWINSGLILKHKYFSGVTMVEQNASMSSQLPGNFHE